MATERQIEAASLQTTIATFVAAIVLSIRVLWIGRWTIGSFMVVVLGSLLVFLLSALMLGSFIDHDRRKAAKSMSIFPDLTRPAKPAPAPSEVIPQTPCAPEAKPPKIPADPQRLKDLKQFHEAALDWGPSKKAILDYAQGNNPDKLVYDKLRVVILVAGHPLRCLVRVQDGELLESCVRPIDPDSTRGFSRWAYVGKDGAEVLGLNNPSQFIERD